MRSVQVATTLLKAEIAYKNKPSHDIRDNTPAAAWTQRRCHESSRFHAARDSSTESAAPMHAEEERRNSTTTETKR